MLRKLRAEQAEEKLRLGAEYRDEGYVFCQPDGRPFHPEREPRWSTVTGTEGPHVVALPPVA